MSKFAWVTLTTNDTYSLGALVLAHSLRRTGTAHQLAVLVTPAVTAAMRQRLQDVYNVVQEVNVLDSQDAANLALLARPELGVTFTKLHCWRLVQFEKCVFLDADTLVLQNCDELFEREELSAAPDVSWPDCFNSGVFVYRPSLETFAKITQFAIENGSFDGGDQGLLNLYFGDWAQSDIKKHLPFIYNVAAFASYCYLPAFKQFRDKIKILHFAGKLKPWLIQFNSENRTALTPTEYAHAADLIQLWWNIFCDNVHQQLSDDMCGAIVHYYYHYRPEPQQQHDHYYQHYEHEQHHHQHHEEHQQHHEHSPSPNYYEFENIKEFRDPWEDYYENLARERSNSIKAREEHVSQEQHHEHHQKHEHHQEHAQHHEHEQHHVHEHHQEHEQHQAHEWQQPEPTHEWQNRAENQSRQPHSEANYEREQPEPQQQQQQEYHEQPQKPIEQYQEHVSHEIHETHDSPASHESHEQSTKHSTSENVETTAIEQQIYEADIHKENTAQKEQQQQQQQDYSSVTQKAQSSDETNTNTISTRSSTDKQAFRSEDVNERETENKDKTNEKNEAGLAGALSQLRLGEQRTPEQEAYEQLMRRQCWEAGQIDYTGRDAFENIWKKITQTLESKPGATPPQEEDKSGGNVPEDSGENADDSERLERINRMLQESAEKVAEPSVADEFTRPLLAAPTNNASTRSRSPAKPSTNNINTNISNNNNNNNATNTTIQKSLKRTASPRPIQQSQVQQQQPRLLQTELQLQEQQQQQQAIQRQLQQQQELQRQLLQQQQQELKRQLQKQEQQQATQRQLQQQEQQKTIQRQLQPQQQQPTIQRQLQPQQLGAVQKQVPQLQQVTVQRQILQQQVTVQSQLQQQQLTVTQQHVTIQKQAPQPVPRSPKLTPQPLSPPPIQQQPLLQTQQLLQQQQQQPRKQVPLQPQLQQQPTTQQPQRPPRQNQHHQLQQQLPQTSQQAQAQSSAAKQISTKSNRKSK
ncbi:alpha-protein kinase 1 isoform X2 [Zeugodacus cucurbitae]|uniref:alpha-protein kinase 1 isoform X2 n=1 Tax=Zeugodacus cucurbitae TaxID=28588 RepID=UPI0023D96CEC|nr:alpha-protein kinase 1 isoform X2 [Zeugodacus cucurbitae]